MPALPHPRTRELPMLRMSVLSVTIASVLGFGWVTRAIASPWRRVVIAKPFETPSGARSYRVSFL